MVKQKPETAATQIIELIVPGMGSNHCAGIVSKTLQRLEGVEGLDVNIARHQVRVRVKEGGPDQQQLREAVEGAGYDVASVKAEGDESEQSEQEIEASYLSQARRRLWIAGIPTTLIMLLMLPQMFWQPLPGYLLVVAVLAFPVVFLFGGAATHKASWRSLKNGTFNMDVLISMGSLPPYLLGLLGFIFPMTSFIEMAATIMTFHLLGRYLEALAKGRASQAIKKLINMGAKTARVERDGKEVEVPVKELQPGDILVVRPGDKVPTDGEVIEGESHLDESLATGESLPVYKAVGDSVIGATLNKEGRLRIKATRVGKDTFLSQVVKLIDQAQGARVPIQEFADRMTGRFVPLVIIIALLSLVGWWLFADALRPILFWGEGFLPWVNAETTAPLLGLLAAIAVLVIACPCALGLATPTALMVGSGIGAERGILIRSGEAIQTFKDIKVIVLDKTGTITRGEPRLTELEAAEGVDEDQLLHLAASVEKASEHPIARAIVNAAEEKEMSLASVQSFQSTGARGVSGEVEGCKILIGNYRLLEEAGVQGLASMQETMQQLEARGRTVILLAADGQLQGLLAVADTLKKESFAAIEGMHRMGLRVVMLTGDNRRAAQAVADEVGIDEVYAEVLPEDKVRIVRELQEKYGQVVAMVGDGINDAAALSQANVGIAIGAGADVAIEAADVTLVKGELTGVVEAMQLSKATFRKIVQNLVWASIYNLAAVPIAALALLHPMIGVIAMTASSLSVIGNSMLLKRNFKPEASGNHS